MIRIATSYEIEAPASRIIGLVTDVAALPRWVPGVTGSSVLAAEGDIRVIELQGPRLHGGRLVLEIVRNAENQIVFAEVDRWRGRGFSGSIGAREGQSENDSIVKIVIEKDGTFLDIVTRRRLRHSVEALADALQQAATAPAERDLVVASGRRKILEIVRRDGKLYALVDGSTIELAPSENGSPS